MKLKTWLIAVSAAGTLAAAPVMADQTMGGGSADYPGAQDQTTEPGMMGGQDMGAQEPGMMGDEGMGAQDGMMGQEDHTAGASEDIVRSVQEALNEQGKDVSVDGIQGPETSQALQEFQENEGLQASGEIDEDTLRALGLEDEAAEFAAAEEEAGIGAQPENGMGAPEGEGDVGVQPEGDTGGMEGGGDTGMGGGL
ncbi:peptidoglycan-binding protein [Ectothiorhodospiraceae bacterium 2226]|nr:peptidoglycan-binding protein [Ectothiorhodospiraceae bacterium 2226]